jgi:hypothetical protein
VRLALVVTPLPEENPTSTSVLLKVSRFLNLRLPRRDLSSLPHQNFSNFALRDELQLVPTRALQLVNSPEPDTG